MQNTVPQGFYSEKRAKRVKTDLAIVGQTDLNQYRKLARDCNGVSVGRLEDLRKADATAGELLNLLLDKIDGDDLFYALYVMGYGDL